MSAFPSTGLTESLATGLGLGLRARGQQHDVEEDEWRRQIIMQEMQAKRQKDLQEMGRRASWVRFLQQQFPQPQTAGGGMGPTAADAAGPQPYTPPFLNGQMEDMSADDFQTIYGAMSRQEADRLEYDRKATDSRTKLDAFNAALDPVLKFANPQQVAQIKARVAGAGAGMDGVVPFPKMGAEAEGVDDAGLAAALEALGVPGAEAKAVGPVRKAGVNVGLTELRRPQRDIRTYTLKNFDDDVRIAASELAESRRQRIALEAELPVDKEKWNDAQRKYHSELARSEGTKRALLKAAQAARSAAAGAGMESDEAPGAAGPATSAGGPTEDELAAAVSELGDRADPKAIAEWINQHRKGK